MGSITGSQITIVPGTELNPNQVTGEMSFYDESGNPVSLAGTTGPVTTASAIGTVAKVTPADEPVANSFVAVQFTNGNSAASPTLAFNGGTARAMKLGGTASAAAKLAIAAGGVAVFFFDGTDLHQIGAYT